MMQLLERSQHHLRDAKKDLDLDNLYFGIKIYRRDIKKGPSFRHTTLYHLHKMGEWALGYHACPKLIGELYIRI